VGGGVFGVEAAEEIAGAGNGQWVMRLGGEGRELTARCRIGLLRPWWGCGRFGVRPVESLELGGAVWRRKSPEGAELYPVLALPLLSLDYQSR
jgi:hypothetical protein